MAGVFVQYCDKVTPKTCYPLARKRPVRSDSFDEPISLENGCFSFALGQRIKRKLIGNKWVTQWERDEWRAKAIINNLVGMHCTQTPCYLFCCVILSLSFAAPRRKTRIKNKSKVLDEQTQITIACRKCASFKIKCIAISSISMFISLNFRGAFVFGISKTLAHWVSCAVVDSCYWEMTFTKCAITHENCDLFIGRWTSCIFRCRNVSFFSIICFDVVRFSVVVVVVVIYSSLVMIKKHRHDLV